jgi:hypothetical protein
VVVYGQKLSAILKRMSHNSFAKKPEISIFGLVLQPEIYSKFKPTGTKEAIDVIEAPDWTE